MDRDRAKATGSRVLLFGLIMGVLAAVAIVLAGILRASGDVRVPVTSIAALLLLASKPLADRVAIWATVPRARVVSALGVLGIAPLLFFGALIALGDPIVSSHWRCGTGDGALVMFAPVGFCLFGATGALIACAVAGNARRRVDAALLGGRRIAVVLSAVILAGAAIRAVHNPDTDRYLDSLPVVGVIRPVAGEPVSILPPTGGSSSDPTRVYEDRLGDLVVQRDCVAAWCDLSLRRANEPLPFPPHKWGSVGVDEHTPLVVTRDAKHDIWVVGRRLAFRGPDLRVTDIKVDTVADALSPPLGWILGAAAGLLLAAGLMIQRRRLARRLSVLASAIAGVHARNGWITMDEGLPPFRAPPDLALAEGPVLVVTAAGASVGSRTYRGAGSPRDVAILSGARANILAEVRGRITALDAFALSAAFLGAAPLAAAWVSGLVL
jgi:hypothetical protein